MPLFFKTGLTVGEQQVGILNYLLSFLSFSLCSSMLTSEAFILFFPAILSLRLRWILENVTSNNEFQSREIRPQGGFL